MALVRKCMCQHYGNCETWLLCGSACASIMAIVRPGSCAEVHVPALWLLCVLAFVRKCMCQHYGNCETWLLCGSACASIMAIVRPGSCAEVHVPALIHISEPTRLGMISYAVFCL